MLLQPQRPVSDVNAELVEAETRLDWLTGTVNAVAAPLREAVEDVVRLRMEKQSASEFASLMASILSDRNSRAEITERAFGLATTVVASAMSMSDLRSSAGVGEYDTPSEKSVESICRDAFDKALRIQLSILGLANDMSMWRVPNGD